MKHLRCHSLEVNRHLRRRVLSTQMKHIKQAKNIALCIFSEKILKLVQIKCRMTLTVHLEDVLSVKLQIKNRDLRMWWVI